jgi:hypothetical protein
MSSENPYRVENLHYLNNRRLEIVVDAVCQPFEGQCKHLCANRFLVDGMLKEECRLIDGYTLISNSYWAFVSNDQREHFYYLRDKIDVANSPAFVKFLLESMKIN